MKTDKVTRVLYLYSLLRDGKKINKSLFSMDLNVSERGFDRDIQAIRCMLSDMGIYDEIVYDRSDNTYYLTGQDYRQLDEAESYIFAKLLLGGKGFRKDEAEKLLEALVFATDRHKRTAFAQKLEDGIEEYKDIGHNQPIVKLIHDLSNCIVMDRRISLMYSKKQYRVKPIKILFEKAGFILVAENEHKEKQRFLIENITSFQII